MSETALHRLAARVGLARDWIDANNRPQQVADEVLRKVLEGLGHPAADDSAVHSSLHAVEACEDSQHLPPLLTAEVDQPLALAHFFAPASNALCTLEDGSQRRIALDAQAHLPGQLPIGYHQVEIEGRTFVLAVAPPRCYSLADAIQQPPPRCWGIAVQLYSLRRTGDGGFGDCLALEQLARSAAERGADALAISPIHALSAVDQLHYSPYSPSSRLLLNTLYASPAAILGERAVRMAIDACRLEQTLEDLERRPLVDWPRAAYARLSLLEALYQDFSQGDHPLRKDFDSYRGAAGQALEHHCRFEVLQAQAVDHGLGGDWRNWPSAWHDPYHPEVEAFANAYPAKIEFHAFCQWLTERSLQRAQEAARSNGMAIGLIADLAVGADGAGSQAWSRQDELLANLKVGAPPDILNRAGQDWGICAFSPEGLKRNGYRAFIEMLRANLAHAGGLRIDHVMGLRRLWLIPRGCKPSEGAYLDYPLEDLLRLLALESVRHQAIILGEDLGTVPEGLREQLADKALLGMRVLPFEQTHPGHFKPILDWPDDALATTGTHDLAPLAGWLQSRDIDWNQRLKLIDAATELHWRHERQKERDGLRRTLEANYGPLTDNDALIDAAIRYVGHTRAPLVLIPLEDLLGSDEQPNLPGTTEGHPNWRRRFAAPVGELLDDEDAARRLELLAQAREQAWERDR
ncbi:4-alpha-glucanotransferase [Pseudomonas plecoglossicida]|uniref:4-alpha-glucanotransferase n=1 Tax=Pseudomonas plecoglossicida TaxID=70775 RepID=A0AAD0QVA9_PSEDL|nr:4-alpha-glucanotransferase [Pseudomonas plecoglossicida]AXM95410.1 4-alpha-glucanotransferase [Pseudomonas plecoglossicida]EPB96259.1 4-alpha-glucanotransferase [Pseudomonas plecoglossicida NB2011]QLB56156.1 4-alpha-glucanotransferase [Pseudomonas plecoglossicida]GLR39183.1 4-alpha-glucanotransferase [Pseudomonas plecoglossicida]